MICFKIHVVISLVLVEIKIKGLASKLEERVKDSWKSVQNSLKTYGFLFKTQ